MVDDGSTDDTAAVAAQNDLVEVLTLRPNRRKGGAMYAGLEYLHDTYGLSDEDVVVFIDSDLRGLHVDHVRRLVAPLVAVGSDWDMIVGMQDYGPFTAVNRSLPLISGQRAVRASYLLRMPFELFDGFGVEVAMNDFVARSGGRTATVVLSGVSPVLKWEKEQTAGRNGVSEMLGMAGEVTRTMVRLRGAAEGAPGSPLLLQRGSAGGNGLLDYRAPNAPDDGLEEAPTPPSVDAECTSTECVTDSLARSIVRAGGPFARDQLWTPEVQERVGEVVGKHVARPLWISAACGSFYFFGPLGLCVTGIAWLVANTGRTI